MSRILDRNRFRPRLENLEDRTTPAVTISPNGNVLNISSNAASDTVRIRDNGNGNLNVTFPNGSFSGVNFQRININMGNGNDRVFYNQTGNRVRNMLLNVNLGNGNDLFTGDIRGNINAGRSLHIIVNGSTGADGIDLTANQNVNILAGGSFRADLFGGDDTDRVDFNYQGAIQGTLAYTVDGQGGNDSGTAFLRATIRANAGSTGLINPGQVLGGLGDDNLAHFVFKLNPADPLLVNATVDGGPGLFFFLAGNDVATRTVNVTSINNETNFVI